MTVLTTPPHAVRDRLRQRHEIALVDLRLLGLGRVQLDHLAPTGIGGSVTAEATLRTIEGRRLTFVVSVKDDRGLVAAGRLTRVVVERDRFLGNAGGE